MAISISKFNFTVTRLFGLVYYIKKFDENFAQLLRYCRRSFLFFVIQ